MHKLEGWNTCSTSRAVAVEQSFEYELLYDSEGGDSKPFVMGFGSRLPPAGIEFNIKLRHQPGQPKAAKGAFVAKVECRGTEAGSAASNVLKPQKSTGAAFEPISPDAGHKTFIL
jgi:hypothetical protein